MTTYIDFTALYDETATEEEVIDCYQRLVDTGVAWQLEGHVGRTVMSLIEDGQIALGPEGQYDYYRNYVPSRFEVEPGTKGSPEYVLERSGRDLSPPPDPNVIEGIADTVERFEQASAAAREDREALSAVRYVVTTGTVPSEEIVLPKDEAIRLADETNGSYARIWEPTDEGEES